MRANDFQTTYISIESPLHSNRLFVLVNDNNFSAITSKVSSLSGRLNSWGDVVVGQASGGVLRVPRALLDTLREKFVTVPGNRCRLSHY
jgi:hypothetical protein